MADKSVLSVWWFKCPVRIEIATIHATRYHSSSYNRGSPHTGQGAIVKGYPLWGGYRYLVVVIFGPMFSGKTTELMRRLKRYKCADYECLIIRYAKDCRYSEDSIASHDGQKLNAISCTNLFTVSKADEYDVIGIDEGQFFQESIVKFAEDMANAGKIVIVAALDATFQRTEFGVILQLVPLAESVVKLNAICQSCFCDASFTKRISDDQQVTANSLTSCSVELIGGADKYMSVCRECYKIQNVVRNSPMKGITRCHVNGNKVRKLDI